MNPAGNADFPVGVRRLENRRYVPVRIMDWSRFERNRELSRFNPAWIPALLGLIEAEQ